MARFRRRVLNVTKRLRLESLERRQLLAAEGLVSHWPLDVKDSGSTLRDEVGTNHLSAIGQLLFEDSDRGRAVVRHGSGSPGAPLTNFEPQLSGMEQGVTVSAWINRSSSFGGFAFAISPLGVQLGTEGNVLHFNATTTADNGTTVDNRIEAEFEFQNDTWYHIAGTYNGERLLLYLNGDDIASNAEARGPLQLDGELFVGSGWTATNSSIRDFRGQLDDVKLFNRALTPQQVAALAETPSTLETSDEPGVYGGEPLRIDPRIEIRSEQEHFGGGALQAAFDPPTTFREGDLISIANDERIVAEDGGVFFRNEGVATRIGDVGDFASGRLRIDLNQNATPRATEALARALVFSSSLENPDSHDRLLTVSLSTHEDVTAFADVRRIVFGQTNTLVLETSAGASEYVLGQSMIIDPEVQVVASGESFAGGSLTVSFVEESGRDSDQLMVRPTDLIMVEDNSVLLRGEASPVAIGTFAGGDNGSPLVIHLNQDAVGHAAESLARAIGYRSTTEFPPDHPRFVRFALDDGNGAEASDVKKIEFVRHNVPPDIVVPDGVTEFPAGSEPLAILPSVSVVDTDSPDFAGGSLVVTFVEESAREGDRLSLQSTDSILVDGHDVLLPDPLLRVGEIDASENGRLLVVHFNEHSNADVAELVSRAVHFGNSAANPDPGRRLVRFEVHDGDNGSDADIRPVDISRSNQAPVIEFSAGATVYTEGSEAVQVDARVEIGDADEAHFGGGSLIASFVELSRREGDFLGLRGGEAISVEGNDIFLRGEGQTIKVADFGFSDNELIIQFNENSNVGVVQQVARAVTFGNALEQVATDSRFIQFTVTDAENGSGSDVRRIEIVQANDAPEVTFSDGLSEYTEGSEPIIIDPQVVVDDADSVHFGGGRLIASFVEESRREGDYLGLRASASIAIENSDLFLVEGTQSIKIAAYGLGEGGLVIEFNENASPSSVQEVARHITFGNEHENISGEDRLVRFKAIDAEGADDFDVRRIAINQINDLPVVHTSDGATVYELAGEPVVVDPRVEIGDSDSEHFGGGSLVISIVQQTGVAGDLLTIVGGEGIEVSGGQVLIGGDAEQILVGEIQESPGSELVIELTEHATPAVTQRLARRVAFSSAVTAIGDNPLRLVQFEVAEGDGSSGADTKQIELFVEADADSDGVDNEIEDAAPNEGDGNRDGIPDSQQDSVASVRGADDRFVTFASPEHTRLENVVAIDVPSPADRPEDAEFPGGFFDFEVTGVDPAELTMVTVNLEPGSSANSYYVFGPTPDDPRPHWYPFHYDGETGAKIYADRIELYYMDGKRGDSDLIVNGIIADPGAPALATHPWRNPSDRGDVNNDGQVTVLDALLIINDLAEFSPRSLPLLPVGSGQLAEKFLDVSGDNESSTLDALQVINIIARNVVSAPASAESVVAIWLSDDDDQRRWDRAVDQVVGELF